MANRGEADIPAHASEERFLLPRDTTPIDCESAAAATGRCDDRLFVAVAHSAAIGTAIGSIATAAFASLVTRELRVGSIECAECSIADRFFNSPKHATLGCSILVLFWADC